MDEPIMHYFMGPPHEGSKDIRDVILCHLPDVKPGDPYIVVVTIVKQDVSCQECLELIHS